MKNKKATAEKKKSRHTCMICKGKKYSEKMKIVAVYSNKPKRSLWVCNACDFIAYNRKK